MLLGFLDLCLGELQQARGDSPEVNFGEMVRAEQGLNVAEVAAQGGDVAALQRELLTNHIGVVFLLQLGRRDARVQTLLELVDASTELRELAA